MSKYTFSFGKAPNSFKNIKSRFGNNKKFIQDNNKNLFNKENSLFKYNQNQKIFSNNPDTTATNIFANNINNLNNNFVTSTTTKEPLFNFGNNFQNKPLNTQQQFNQGLGLQFLGNNNEEKKLNSKSLFEGINFNQGIIGNNLKNDNNNPFMSNLNQKGGIAENNNIFEAKLSLLSGNQNDGNKMLSPNFNNNPNEQLFDNNKSGEMKLFNDNTQFTLFNDINNNESKQGNLLFNNNKSLFNNNEKMTNNEKKFLQVGTDKSSFGNLFTNELSSNSPNKSANNTSNIFENKQAPNTNNFFSFKKPNNIPFFENKANVNIGKSFNISNNTKINNISFQIPFNNNNNQNFIFENDNNSNIKDLGLWPNINNIQSNNNINNNIYNNEINNFTSKEKIAFNEISDPLNYFSSQDTTNLTSNDEILTNKFTENIEKQKDINQFLDDLDQKYNKKENNDDYINNNANDILDNYGNYLENSENYSYNIFEKEQPLLYSNESFKSHIENPKKIISKENGNIYSMREMNNSLSKINNIYEEYEKYKNQFIDNSSNKIINNINVDNKKINNIKDITKSKPNQYEYQSSILGRNEPLYHKNIKYLDKLSKNEIKFNNDFKYINEKKAIAINNNEEDIMTEYNSQKIDLPTNIDLTIKYNSEDKNSSKKNILTIKNNEPSKKINSLKTEIENKILDVLKLKKLDQFYSIENISLYILDNPLLEENSLKDYDLKACNFTIDAFIIYKENNINREQDKFVPLELVPKLTKVGYKCNPSILELSRKTEEELKKVEGFRIFNKYGEVEFMEPVNLLGLNLDEQITIEPNVIDTGDKLDYNSKFKLYNFIVKEEALNAYKTNLEKCGGNFVEYKNNEIVWEYNKNEK